MSKFANLSRTDLSALISVALFGMTILVSAVGPAEAQGSMIIDDNNSSPTVSHDPLGHKA